MTPRPRIPIRGGLAWALALVSALVAIDLVERLVLYEAPRRDGGALGAWIRRPASDTALALLHGLSRLRPPGAAGLAVFDLYFRPRDARELQAALTRVRIAGRPGGADRRWLPARLAVGGERFDVRVRLRGRPPFHVLPPRPSLRIELRRGRSYRGSDRFDLIEPFDRETDRLLVAEAASHGLIEWESQLGVLAIGGEPVAIVQYVEQLREATAARNRRPEGSFFRGTGERTTTGSHADRCDAAIARMAEWLASPRDTVPWEPLERIVDLDRFGWYTAIGELSGEARLFSPSRVRGFCDPFAARIEPVIWESGAGDWSRLAERESGDEGSQFLRNDRYRLLHDQKLHRLVTERLEPMLVHLRELHRVHQEILSRDPLYWFPRGGSDGFMPGRMARLEATLRSNARAIRAALEGGSLEWYVDAPRRRVLLRTADRGAKRVDALRVAGIGELRLEDPLLIPGRFRDRQPVAILPLPQGVAPGAVEGVIATRLHGGDALEAVRAQAPPRGEPVWPLRSTSPELPRLPRGFQAEAAAQRVRVGPGRIRVRESLLLPDAWSLAVQPGTTLLMEPDTLLEVRGDLSMPGTAAAPIVVRGASGDGWGAIAVLGERTRPARVEIAHTTLRGGRGSSRGSALHQASLSVQHGDVRLDQLRVEGGLADASFACRHCQVEARDCRYRDGAGNAVAYDFASGRDLRTRIERFSGDGIALRGARVVVEGGRIRDVGGAGLRVAGASLARIEDVEVAAATSGCVVTDRSEVAIDGLTVVRADSALSLFSPGPRSGASRASVRGLAAADVAGLAVVEDGDALELREGIRVGSDPARLRDFPGIRNVVHPGLDRLDRKALLALATRSRALARRETTPESAGVGSGSGARDLARAGGP